MLHYKLLTPGPLTTTETVKQQMLDDHCTWDDDYKKITRAIRERLLELAHVSEPEYTTVLMQGSGTFGVESVLTSVIGTEDVLLIAANGAYGKRMAEIANHAGISYILYEEPYDTMPSAEKVKELLGQYKGDVESLKQFVSQDGFSVAQLNEKIKEFNDKYSVLDDDLYIEYFDENDGISADDFNEYLEEIDELLKDIEEDADEEFADMFEDWLESFKSHHRDDDDD